MFALYLFRCRVTSYCYITIVSAAGPGTQHTIRQTATQILTALHCTGLLRSRVPPPLPALAAFSRRSKSTAS